MENPRLIPWKKKRPFRPAKVRAGTLTAQPTGLLIPLPSPFLSRARRATGPAVRAEAHRSTAAVSAEGALSVSVFDTASHPWTGERDPPDRGRNPCSSSSSR